MFNRIKNIGTMAGRRFSDVWDAILDPKPDEYEAERIALKARDVAPVIWLLGKVQSGKSSLVRAITHSSDAEIGEGYKACTKTAQVFDFPSEAPVIRFLDTRGLGEVAYDPSEDLAFCEGKAHLLLAVMKALDVQQQAVVEVVTSVRQRHPEWPVIVAQTCLHEAYRPGQNHLLPYLYDADPTELMTNQSVPPDLARSLAFQRQFFDKVPGHAPLIFTPVDFTRKEDGFSPADYGSEAFKAALEKAAPLRLSSLLHEMNLSDNDAFASASHAHILGYSAAAAAVDAVPVAGLVAVPGVQAKLLHSLGRIYHVEWDKQTIGEFAACLGTSTILRLLASLGIRELVKVVPVYGQTAGTAAAMATSFATTYALGKASGYFLARRRIGENDPEGVVETYSRELARALTLAKERNLSPHFSEEEK